MPSVALHERILFSDEPPGGGGCVLSPRRGDGRLGLRRLRAAALGEVAVSTSGGSLSSSDASGTASELAGGVSMPSVSCVATR